MNQVVVALVGVGLVISATGQSAGAAGDQQGAEISSSVSSTQSPPPPTPAPDPPCGWAPFPANEVVAEVYNVLAQVSVVITTLLTMTTTEVTVEYYSEGNVLHRYDLESGEYQYKRTFECEAGASPADGQPAEGTPDWVTVAPPDPILLLDRTKVVTTAIPAPTPDISPAPDAGVPVNLGLWIAVAEAGPYIARASLGPNVWAERTATLRSITFDPGNGDAPVVCAGFGTPIPDAAVPSAEPGSCGYVYVSYDDVVADLTVTISATWEVGWRLSDGRTGSDPDLVTSVGFPYDVYEVQTIGTG